MTKDKKKLSRRKFIKAAGVLATGFTIVPRHILGGVGFIAPSDKLNIAGVGAGGRGNGILNLEIKSPTNDPRLVYVREDRQMVVEVKYCPFCGEEVEIEVSDETNS